MAFPYVNSIVIVNHTPEAYVSRVRVQLAYYICTKRPLAVDSSGNEIQRTFFVNPWRLRQPL